MHCPILQRENFPAVRIYQSGGSSSRV